jgi:hypothetical protein
VAGWRLAAEPLAVLRAATLSCDPCTIGLGGRPRRRPSWVMHMQCVRTVGEARRRKKRKREEKDAAGLPESEEGSRDATLRQRSRVYGEMSMTILTEGKYLRTER